MPAAVIHFRKNPVEKFDTRLFSLKEKLTHICESTPCSVSALFKRIQALPAPPLPAYVLMCITFKMPKNTISLNLLYFLKTERYVSITFLFYFQKSIWGLDRPLCSLEFDLGKKWFFSDWCSHHTWYWCPNECLYRHVRCFEWGSELGLMSVPRSKKWKHTSEWPMNYFFLF